MSDITGVGRLPAGNERCRRHSSANVVMSGTVSWSSDAKCTLYVIDFSNLVAAIDSSNEFNGVFHLNGVIHESFDLMPHCHIDESAL